MGMTHTSAWDFFDRVYCITLDSRPDRMAAARRQFAQVGLGERVEYLTVSKDTADPARGIFRSHLRCLRQALDTDAERILIFEDDVLFRRFSPLRLRQACAHLRALGDWDGFFLGCITTGSGPTGEEAVARIEFRCLCHAYALNRPFAERIVGQQWQGLPFDSLLQRAGADFYALRPMCAFQGPTTSDNRTVWIDWLRNLFGGLALIQRGNELFQNHKGRILALHLVLAAALLITFFLARR